jgi:hypothetical protein
VISVPEPALSEAEGWLIFIPMGIHFTQATTTGCGFALISPDD